MGRKELYTRWRLEDKGVQGEVGTHRELWRDLLSRQRQWLLSGNIALSFLDNWCYLLNSHLMITTEIHPFSQYLAKSSHTESAKILPLPRSPTLMEDWIRFYASWCFSKQISSHQLMIYQVPACPEAGDPVGSEEKDDSALHWLLILSKTCWGPVILVSSSLEGWVLEVLMGIGIMVVIN